MWVSTLALPCSLPAGGRLLGLNTYRRIGNRDPPGLVGTVKIRIIAQFIPFGSASCCKEKNRIIWHK